jgi:hypothetical protein
MRPLPHIITDDEFFLATEEQRQEWNARMAAGSEPADLSVCAPLNLPKPGSWEETLQLWEEQRARELGDDDEADRQRGSWGE